MLQEFLSRCENPPPISAVLYTLNPNWDAEKEVCTDETEEDRRHRRNPYTSVFQRIDERVRSFAAGSSTEARSISVDSSFLTDKFRPAPANAVAVVSLPPELTIWIAQERIRLEKNKLKAALVDTFLLLTVIGAFGSLVFLTRDYIMKEETTAIGAYIFRPVLGVFLAIAIFTLDIFAHAIISTAGILEIRHEPLYVLALLVRDLVQFVPRQLFELCEQFREPLI
jgi:hypothetical protein